MVYIIRKIFLKYPRFKKEGSTKNFVGNDNV